MSKDDAAQIIADDDPTGMSESLAFPPLPSGWRPIMAWRLVALAVKIWPGITKDMADGIRHELPAALEQARKDRKS